MIVTYTQNLDGNGQRRVYLGGQGSMQCWIEPNADNIGWTFRLEPAVTGNALTAEQQREWAVYTLTELAGELNVSPYDLATVPFECIMALHTADPFNGRRIPTGRSRIPPNSYIATAPGVTRPSASDYRSADYTSSRHRRA